MFTTANSELEKASNWFQLNKLTLNVSKSKYILFRTKKWLLISQIFSLNWRRIHKEFARIQRFQIVWIIPQIWSLNWLISSNMENASSAYSYISTHGTRQRRTFDLCFELTSETCILWNIFRAKFHSESFWNLVPSHILNSPIPLVRTGDRWRKGRMMNQVMNLRI